MNKEELENQIKIIREQLTDADLNDRYDEAKNLRKKWNELGREIYFIKNEVSDLEKNFVKVSVEARSKIDDQLAIADEALNKAEKISNEYGIPFKSGIVRNYDMYVPENLSKKWDSVDKEFIQNYFDFEELSTGEFSSGYFNGYFNGYGWTKSYC